jgi:hypothetical protein
MPQTPCNQFLVVRRYSHEVFRAFVFSCFRVIQFHLQQKPAVRPQLQGMTTMQVVSPAPVLFDPAAATGLAVAAGICLIGPILAALWWHRRSGTPLAAFGAGALVFLVSQVILRLPWQIPLGAGCKSIPSG